ncbi:hypothetical protein JRQ81_005039 [Phrynocephalus forsythii]|uniref:Ras-related protein Rab-23 n=1 Tax=Phrynocephalus forsythii TaxID=171643 RepID=A0A9Q1B5P4_9SAUR|nr:hypothetical protein JRQ81_005039 [Phrynocephalus forsythii]
MLEEDMEVAIKVVVVGNGAVGKSSMIQRYCKGIFTKDYKKTIGVDFLEREMQVNDEDVRLMLWDTAGQKNLMLLLKLITEEPKLVCLSFQPLTENRLKPSLSGRKKW